MYSNNVPEEIQPMPLWAKAFFTALRASGVVSKAAAAAGIDRRTAYKYKDNAEFMECWRDALDEYADALEAEALRRVVEGVEEPVFYRGVEVGHIRKYPENLMIFMLKGAKPDKYKERIEQTNTLPDLSGLSDEEFERLEARYSKNAR